MNKWLTSSLGLGVPALLVLWATHGEQFITAVHAAVLFLFSLAHDAPLGVGAFALAIAVAVAAQGWFERFITAPCANSRQAILSGVGFAFGAGVMYVQLHTAKGLLLALLAGFVAPFAHQCVAAAIGLLRRDKAAP